MFPKIGQTRTRGMFRTLDAPNLRLGIARFAPDDYVPKAMLVEPTRVWYGTRRRVAVEPTMTGRDPWAADAGRRYLKPMSARTSPYAGKVYTATYSTRTGQRIDYEMLEARVFEHMLSRMEEGKPYRISRIHDCIDLEPIAEECDADHATTA